MPNFIGLLGASVFGWLAAGSIPFWATIVLAPVVFLITRGLATILLGAYLDGHIRNTRKQVLSQVEPRSEPAAAYQPVNSPFRESSAQQGDGVQKPRLGAAAQAAMAEHGISFEDGRYVFRGYRYEKLDDAINYARLAAQRRSG